MRKAKHTPGPWALFVCDGEFSVMPAGRQGDIATGIKSEADANLLRAAPDMLAALKGIIDPSGDIDDPSLRPEWHAVYAAIAKAEMLPQE